MSLASQAQDLAAQGAAFRLAVFGVNQSGAAQVGKMEGAVQTFPCYFSPVRSHEQLDAAMFKDVHDCILRVAKTEPAFSPTIGKNVVLLFAKAGGGDLTLRISELGHSGLNPEYIVGCKAVF